MGTLILSGHLVAKSTPDPSTGSNRPLPEKGRASLDNTQLCNTQCRQTSLPHPLGKNDRILSRETTHGITCVPRTRPLNWSRPGSQDEASKANTLPAPMHESRRQRERVDKELSRNDIRLYPTNGPLARCKRHGCSRIARHIVQRVQVASQRTRFSP